MKIPRVLDKASRKIGNWLQDHNFRKEELWPARKSFEQQVNAKFAKYLSVLNTFDQLRPDTTEMELGNGGEFTSYGAFMFSDLINKHILDISSYSNNAQLSAVRVSYGNRVNSIMAIGKKVVYATLLDKCTQEKLLDETRWSDVLRECPELLLLPMFVHPDCVHYSHRLIRGIFAIQHYDAVKFHLYDTGKKAYREKLLEDLLHVMCDGLHVLSYGTYSKMHTRLPNEFSARLPSLKLKMKACSNDEYFYTARSNNGVR